MGQEIGCERFSKADYARFRERLADETALLESWFAGHDFSDRGDIAGFELEAWLTGPDNRPLPANDRFLALLDSPLASPELARFNIELNSTPRPLHGAALRMMHEELNATWEACRRTAAQFDAGVAMIGILPTVSDADLTLANMSGLTRYRALNEQVLAMRGGRPLVFDIDGREHLHVEHHDVMLESAATSFQLHLQVGPAQAAQCFNAAIALSAPMVAACANSPYLFGRDLWDETRIPLFEQAVAVGGYDGAAFGPIRRVTFGSGYAHSGLMDLFRENRDHYPVLLPVPFDTPPGAMAHLRLHNGTIWRWNRPLIGFDDDGRPHLRIEHRVVAAGPSVIDTLANAAFFYGVMAGLGDELAAGKDTIPARLDFSTARNNFYTAARLGLRARVTWFDGHSGPIQKLISERLLPLAEAGLARLGIDVEDRRHYLSVFGERVRSARNGAAWQREYVARHGADRRVLTEAYLVRQDSGAPVHTWSV